MTKKEMLEKVQEAYNKLDEALSAIKSARRELDEAEEMTGSAFSMLEEIPENASEIEEDEKEEEDA
jgi:hypothetical protein